MEVTYFFYLRKPICLFIYIRIHSIFMCMVEMTINDIVNMHHFAISNISNFCVFLNFIITFPKYNEFWDPCHNSQIYPYKHTTCIPHWNDVETVVSASFQRGIHVVCLKESWRGGGVAGIAKAITIVIKSYKTNNTFLIEFRTGYSNVKEILRLPLHCHCHLVNKIGIIKPSHSPPSEVYCKLSWLAGVQRWII